MLIYIGVLHFVLRKFMFYYENTLLQASKHRREHVSHLLFCIVGSIIMIPFVVKITDLSYFLKASGKALFTFIDHIFICFYIPSSLNIPI